MKLPMIAADVDVPIPASLVFHTSGINLHEAHAALHQSPRHQALPREVFAGGIVEAIKLLNHLRLARNI